MNRHPDSNLKYYQIGGITIQVEADLPFNENTFDEKFKHFVTSEPGKERVVIRHHFSFPPLEEEKIGQKVYEFPPWLIRQAGDKWYYFGYSPWERKKLYLLAIISRDFTQVDVFHQDARAFLQGRLPALTAFPTDQILLAQVFPRLHGAYFHGAGVILEERGLIFLGHSGRGKSTITRFFIHQPAAKILCDDRIILRRQQKEWRLYGTWSHGEIPLVSPDSAPLAGLFFLKKARKNRLLPLESPFEVFKRLIDLLVKPHPSAEWWDRVTDVCQNLAYEIPAYELEFDLSGDVVKLFR
jgi:hypothetical protein